MAGIAFLPGNKEDLLVGDLAIPSVIGVAQVLHHNGVLRPEPSGFHAVRPMSRLQRPADRIRKSRISRPSQGAETGCGINLGDCGILRAATS